MRSLIVLAAVFSLGWNSFAAPAEAPASQACCVAAAPADPGAAAAAPVDAQKAFGEISVAVIGKWKMDPASEEGKQMSGLTEFKLTAQGTVLMETMLPGTKMEMVNLFALDGEDLLVTHYCASGNQPRMKLTSAGNGVYTFEFKDGTNIKADVPYMGKLVLRIVDGKVIEEWTHFSKGQAAGQMRLPLVRA